MTEEPKDKQRVEEERREERVLRGLSVAV